MTLKERDRINVQYIKAITFGLKVIEEMLAQFFSTAGQGEVKAFLIENCHLLMQVMCLSCEQGEQVIKNQAQILFQLVMFQILDLKIPIREQFEIMYIKCVLKPLVNRIK
jgi:hypothetical protein